MFPISLQLELMALLWGILSVLLFIADYSYNHWGFRYGAILTVIIATIYFIASIVKAGKNK